MECIFKNLVLFTFLRLKMKWKKIFNCLGIWFKECFPSQQLICGGRSPPSGQKVKYSWGCCVVRSHFQEALLKNLSASLSSSASSVSPLSPAGFHHVPEYSVVENPLSDHAVLSGHHLTSLPLTSKRSLIAEWMNRSSHHFFNPLQLAFNSNISNWNCFLKNISNSTCPLKKNTPAMLALTPGASLIPHMAPKRITTIMAWVHLNSKRSVPCVLI